MLESACYNYPKRTFLSLANLRQAKTTLDLPDLSTFYLRAGFITGELQRLLGPGILTAEGLSVKLHVYYDATLTVPRFSGNPHKRQRKVILPAFGTERIKGYAPIMFEIGHVVISLFYTRSSGGRNGS